MRMRILAGWDTSDLRTTGQRQTIDVKTITPEELAQIKKQHDDANLREPTWGFFGGVVNLGHRHFQVSP